MHLRSSTAIGLVLAAGVGALVPGPLVSNLGTTAGSFPIPMAIVPGHLSDEDLDAMSLSASRSS